MVKYRPDNEWRVLSGVAHQNIDNTSSVTTEYYRKTTPLKCTNVKSLSLFPNLVFFSTFLSIIYAERVVALVETLFFGSELFLHIKQAVAKERSKVEIHGIPRPILVFLSNQSSLQMGDISSTYLSTI